MVKIGPKQSEGIRKQMGRIQREQMKTERQKAVHPGSEGPLQKTFSFAYNKIQTVYCGHYHCMEV